MRVDQLLRECIVSDPKAFGLSKQVVSDDVHVILRTSPVRSATGRIHCHVYVGNGSSPTIIAQVTPFADNRLVTARNPYSPQDAEAASQLADVLPLPAGEIVDGKRRLYWARYIPWPSLRDTLNDLVPFAKLVDRLRQPPWTRTDPDRPATQQSADPLTEYLAMVHRVCSLWNELDPYESDLIALLERRWHKVKLGFSHGDLWCQDVLCSDSGQLCILDWEWSAAARPVGTDLFDLALSTISIYYSISIAEALTFLTRGEGKVERFFRRHLGLLWDNLGYDADTRYLSILTYLIHTAHRITLQCDRSLPGTYDGAALGLAITMASPTYLLPLVGAKDALAKEFECQAKKGIQEGGDGFAGSSVG